MKWTGLNELRELFLTFFESKGHLRLPSAPLVPQDDASLLLINSGMAPLKNYFTGTLAPPAKRVTTCQKCVRTPDIENVGKTSRHGTYFEMLGNFSFGDYFKEEATTWAWEFITQVLEIPLDKLWISIYENDDEAFDIWTKNRGVDPERIVRLGKADNFWEIGTGPCGPCSEIYYDRGPENGCDSPDCAVGCECDRYVEFWNLVFTQFDSDGKGNYTPLAKPNIDTGMGLERLACIMQGVGNLFEVDTMQNIMQHIAKIAGVQYKTDERTDVSLRVITDHIRSTVFMVGDGVVPQNEGRGYVLRRLLRRAARHGRLLGIERPFLFEVCDTVIKENLAAYPELEEKAEYIRKVIGTEEERFSRTIAAGMELLGEMIDAVSKAQISGRLMLDGKDVFRLYDTFGFPLDLTKEIAMDRGIDIDEDGFVAFMKAQRERARNAREKLGDVSWEDDVLSGSDIDDKFVGYDSISAPAVIASIVKDGQVAGEIAEGDDAVIILDQTPFYAESGGQVGDTGTIRSGNAEFEVTGCKKSATGHIMHVGRMKSGALASGESVTAGIDVRRRRAITRNHTAAHLLQAALRTVLGTHVHQAGSMVDETVCRFDFTHFSQVTSEQLREVERGVNEMILAAYPVTVTEMSMDDAKKKGAMALFGDKYTANVRVCDIAGKSVELCGGTHVSNSSEIGLMHILRESSVASGVRRIEAVTGFGVLDYIDGQTELLHGVMQALKAGSPQEIATKVQSMSQQLRDTQRELEQLRSKSAGESLSQQLDAMEDLGKVRCLAARLDGADPDSMRNTADNLRAKYENIVGVLAAEYGGKVTLLAFAGKEAVAAGINCGKLVKNVAAIGGGGGGGRPDSAMGALPDAGCIDQVLAGVSALVKEMIG